MRNGRALVLEDSLSAATVAVGVLRGLGYVVELQQSVLGALGALGRRFDLVLIDVSVPDTCANAVDEGAGGIRVAAVARNRWPAARVVLWSACDHREAARELGCSFASKGPRAGLRDALTLALRQL